MPGLQVLTVTVAPALFWAVYHYHRDRHQPEPMLILFLTYGLGIVAGYLGVYAYEGLDWLGLRANAYELALSDRTALFFYCVLVIWVVEEGVKLIPFLLVWVRLKHFDERIDGIIYASFIALDFASYENFHYMVRLTPGEALLRGIASPMVHILFASIWGHLRARAVVNRTALWPAALIGLAIAAAAHGVYDYFMIGAAVWARPFAAFLILCIWTWRKRLIGLLHRE